MSAFAACACFVFPSLPMSVHIILQSPHLYAPQVEKVAALASAEGVQALGPTAVRLLHAQDDTRAQVEALCLQAGMDCAYLARIRHIADCRILAMDMDSTLVNIECIDEIAAAAGRKAEVAAITEAAMRGEIKDFAESLRRRVALLKGVPEQALHQVYEHRLQLNPGAQRLVETARGHGLATLLVSGGFTFFTRRLQERLRLDHCHANVLKVHEGKLTGEVEGPIVDGAAKAAHLQALAKDMGADPEHIIAMGDGANDLAMLALAEYSVAYRAKPVVREQARFALNFSPLDAVLNWFRLRH
ncbi:phosphoserine phosphatase SerB [Allopusillimonas soli]